MKAKAITLFAIFIISLMLTTPAATAFGSDNVANYETNEYLPGLDIWVNQSTAPMQPLSSGHYAPAQVGWELHRYVLLPASVDLSTWIIQDTAATFIVGGFGGVALDPAANSYSVSAAGEEKTETGLTSFGSRAVDGVTNVDANQRVSAEDTNIVDATYDHVAAASGIDSVEYNYTVPENKITSGIAYDANDKKSVNDYADDLADSDGKTLYGVTNASMIAYAFESFDDLQAVTWNFDDTNLNAPGQPSFSLRRVRVWMKSNKVAATVNNGFLGTRSTSRVPDMNVFKKINLGNSLAGIPSGAKHFMSKLVPSNFLSNPLSTGSILKSVAKRAGAFLSILLTIGAVLLIFYYLKNKKR